MTRSQILLDIAVACVVLVAAVEQLLAGVVVLPLSTYFVGVLIVVAVPLHLGHEYAIGIAVLLIGLSVAGSVCPPPEVGYLYDDVDEPILLTSLALSWMSTALLAAALRARLSDLRARARAKPPANEDGSRDSRRPEA